METLDDEGGVKKRFKSLPQRNEISGEHHHEITVVSPNENTPDPLSLPFAAVAYALPRAA